ncbi:hypothetical protein ACPOL_2563 [Acidisarcina polymorpha]|uniref:Uncharacterized protein n=1 Tax=Acidisarcina polymorpha TaxID=2211140 RepID=A0A2Z5FYA3_9BACT|nr:hypothetical protein [Acidisarcina polymorpha]AXC11883.1 hypothetical protein ACPOL_2563 [Acidisarcina polymorpha]
MLRMPIQVLAALAATLFFMRPLQAQRAPLPAGVEKICSLSFSKDPKRPARVENSALPCLQEVAEKLKQTPQIKLVLIGISHPLYDRADEDRGMEREGEDMTGTDIRFSDVAAYRAINTKSYLTQWLGSDPARIIPTTDEYALGQEVLIFSVPANADFFHNYTRTTPINESRCTITPCPNPDEDVLTPQPRSRIPTESAPASPK